MTGTDNGTGHGQGTTIPPDRPGLHLDARQRAMLEEMGVHVRWPGAAGAGAGVAAAALSGAPLAVPAPAPRPAGAPFAGHPNPPTRTAPPAAPAAQAAAVRQTLAPAQPPAAPRAMHTAGISDVSGAWALQPPRALFPNADPQHTPPALGAGWLIVVEGRAGSDPLAGDAGRLLENMLRALQLHRHPRTFVCLLDALPASDPPGPAGGETATATAAAAAAIAAVQPAVLLLLGRTVARALLGRSDPLGRLRAERLQVAGVPTVVSYDAPYLLRAPPETKALVWADLCRARALAGAPTALAAGTGAAGTGAAGPHA